MKITIVNNERNEKRFSRMELDEFVAQLADDSFLQQNTHDFSMEVCFAAEWVKQNGEVKAKSLNRLVLMPTRSTIRVPSTITSSTHSSIRN